MNIVTTTLKQFGRLSVNALMSKYTTLHIGGSAQFFIEVTETEKFVELLRFLVGEGIPYYLLGGGSNMLWQDELFEGVVVKVATGRVDFLPGEVLKVDAGVASTALVMNSIKHKLRGLEWAMGLPGTIGGAVRGNAGAPWKDLIEGNGDIASLARSVSVFRDGEVIDIPAAECAFAYRDSIFKHSADIVLSAEFQLEPGNPQTSLAIVQEINRRRAAHYPKLPSAGSFFKNVDFKDWPGDIEKLPEHFARTKKVPSGWINEQNGLKGYRVGGAMVSNEHGNFIVNVDNATQADVLNLVEEINRRAYTTFGVTLEPEVMIIRL